MSNDLVLRETGLRQVTCIVRERQLRFSGSVGDFLRRIPSTGSFVVEIRGLVHAVGASARFMFASGILSEGYGHGGPGVVLGDGQMEAEGVPSQRGRGDAMLRCMLPYPTWPDMCLRSVSPPTTSWHQITSTWSAKSC